jgi:3-dehydroquinate synthase
VGTGLLDTLDEYLASRCPASGYGLVTDTTVERLYGARVKARLETLAPVAVATFPAGEWNKTRDTWAAVSDTVLSAALDRSGVIVALGGGVVGDLAGFVAATYLRGVRYVQVPTTLLAMTDSSIGGKTGVDTALGKNLVGAFHQPSLVVADVSTLSTLAPVHLAAGAAEALKHGVIADAQYLERLISAAPAVRARDPRSLFDIVRRSVEIKAAVVRADEREQGQRAMLNFGHTVAHALEAALGYEILHGEAVALGMLAESRIGESCGVCDATVAPMVRRCVEAYELPTEPPSSIDVDRAIETMRHDKKSRGGTVRFAFPSRVGQMARASDGEWTHAAPIEEIRSALAPWG